ncbi:hypothetical protein HG536_0D00180 [Torulaspora globosa]|uniref:Sir1 ORC-binding domain-containing protein n=1 Tax=Torulaspora globosa TaxID=48254 RepID=A0A7G3ZG60_9SACH|nr:uncharacterized protein HG536_0D00180 [Torulaspora globosa]QLL32496.1 hypothetical protein HG536_0D00180 [Torulaspora globosa]
MKRYAAISLSEGYFTIIDGFLVSLCSPRVDQLAIGQTLSHESKEKIRCLVSLYKPDMVLKMERMSSNFYITGHSLLFELAKDKVYVHFVRTKGKYYCRKTDPKSATHVALEIRVARRRGPRRPRYVVYEMPLEQSPAFAAVIQQQSRDLARIDSPKMKGAFGLSATGNDTAKADIKLLSEKELLECVRNPVSPRIIEQVPGMSQETRRQTSDRFRNILLKFCERQSMHKLEKMKKVLLEFPDRSHEISELYRDGARQIVKNLTLASERVFPAFLDRIVDGDAGSEKISDRFVIVDRLLIDLRSRMVINPEGANFLNTATVEEKARLSKHRLMSWAAVESAKEPMVIRTQRLFDVIDHTLKEFRAGAKNSSKETSADGLPNPFVWRQIMLHFENLGSKCVIMESVRETAGSTPEGKFLESSKLPPGTDGSISFVDLTERFKRFCSYEEQLALYVETVGLLVGRKFM